MIVCLDVSLNNIGYAVFGDNDVLLTSGTETHVKPKKRLKTDELLTQVLIQLQKFYNLLNGADVVVIEKPTGSQSASGAYSYMYTLALTAIAFYSIESVYQVKPTDSKLVTVGDKKATKHQMIEWAVSQYPTACWDYQTRKGKQVVVKKYAEHLADALALYEVYKGYHDYLERVSL